MVVVAVLTLITWVVVVCVKLQQWFPIYPKTDPENVLVITSCIV